MPRDELQMMQKRMGPGLLGGAAEGWGAPGSSCALILCLFCAGRSWPHQALPVPPPCSGQYSHLQTKKLRLRKGK